MIAKYVNYLWGAGYSERGTSGSRRGNGKPAVRQGACSLLYYLLDSVLASTMLSNSEFIVMFNQAASDREKLAKLLNISPEQMSYITNSEPGCGLIRYGRALVPFKNELNAAVAPTIYSLLTTRPGE